MASATRLASGSWRAQASKTIKGVKVRKSFTVKLDEVGGDWRKARDKAELLARKWRLAQEEVIANGKTVKEAIESYMRDKSEVLSPSTKRGYKAILKSIEPIEDLYISSLDNSIIQQVVNDWSKKVKYKTIDNRIGLLSSVLNYYEIKKNFKITYPQNISKKNKKVKSPDLPVVKKILDSASPSFKPILYLAAFGSLRRGEIAGLRNKDVSKENNTVSVNGDIVLGENGWIYKPYPKTEGSERSVELPVFVIESLPTTSNPEDFIFKVTPSALTDRMRYLANKLGVNCTLHSLRHYAASFRSDLGIPQKYIEEVGGWENESVILKDVYDNTLESSRRKYAKMANDYIEQNFRNK